MLFRSFLDATLDAVAACARAGGDERTAPQLRCDALTGMCLDTPHRAQRLARRGNAPSAPPPGGAGDPGGERRAHRAPGADGTPGADPPASRRLLPDGVPLEGLLTALSHLVGSTSPWWTPSGTGPVHPAPGLSVTVDVTVPLDRLIGPPPEPGRDRPPGTAPPDDPGDPPPDDPSSAPGPPGASSSDSPPIPRVSIGGRTAPVPDAVARALAAGGTWRHLVTDPLSGAVIDVGRTRYRP